MWFLAPPRAWTRLPAFVPGLVDVARDRRRADERHGGDVRVGEDRVDRDLVAVDDVEDAVRDPGLGQELGQEVRRGRVLLGRLEDERVAAGDGRREHPHRHHRREVERRDAGHDPERLADLVDVDAARHLLAEPTLEQVRDAAGELEVLEATGDLAQRVGRDLAVLGGQVRRQFVPACLDQVPDLEHDVGALRERRRPPGREGRRCRRDGSAQLVGRGEVHELGDLAGRRVEDLALAAGRPGDEAPADPVADPGRARSRPSGPIRVLRPASWETSRVAPTVRR